MTGWQSPTARTPSLREPTVLEVPTMFELLNSHGAALPHGAAHAPTAFWVPVTALRSLVRTMVPAALP